MSERGQESRGEPRAGVRIVVPWDVARTSLNTRLHWRERKRRNDAAKWSGKYAWAMAGRPEYPGAVRVRVTIRRGRRMDSDNAFSGCKAVVDSMFCRRRNGYGVTEDDSERWLRYDGLPVQEIGARWKGREEIVFDVVALGADGGDR